jgi:hypothetical protein
MSAARRTVKRVECDGETVEHAPNTDDNGVSQGSNRARMGGELERVDPLCLVRAGSGGGSSLLRRSRGSSVGSASDMLEGGDSEGEDDGGEGGAGDSSLISNTAAATLQRATRGMLARKSFRRVKRQAMASLVIQKSLFMWWVQKGSAQS